MRTLWRIAAVLAALGLLAIAGLVFFLPRMVDSSELRNAIAKGAQSFLGRPLEYDSLSVGFWPPAFEIHAPKVAGSGPAAPPLLTADLISLELALAPLLRFEVELGSVVVESLKVFLTYGDKGLDLPPFGSGSASESGSSPDDSSFSLVIREVDVSDSRLTLRDETVSPPVTLILENISLVAEEKAAGRPIQLTGSLTWGAGGRLTVTGQATLEGAFDVQVGLQDFSLAPLSAYLEPGSRTQASLAGKLTARGQGSKFEALQFAGKLSADPISTAGAKIQGDVEVAADLSGEAVSLGGSVSLDAASSAISYPPVFEKPKGTEALLSGKISQKTAGAIQFDFEKFQLASGVFSGQWIQGKRQSLRVSASPFDLAPLAALFPAVNTWQTGGKVSVADLRLRSDPLSVDGMISLDPFTLRAVDAKAREDRIDVTGEIRASGETLTLSNFVVAPGGQRIRVQGRISDLDGAMRFEVSVHSEGVLQADRLLSALAPQTKGVLHGPVTISGDLAGYAGAGHDSLDSLDGRMQLNLGTGVGNGREGGKLEGFSALTSVFEGLSAAGDMARLANLFTAGKVPDLKRFTGDEFDRLDARLEIKSGHANVSQAQILYRAYGLNVEGQIALEDLSLDMTGAVDLGPDVVQALGVKIRDTKVVVPLAHIGGTVKQPKVSVSDGAARGLARELLLKGSQIEGVAKGLADDVEKTVPGIGGLLRGGVEGLIGGRKK